ncbi:hypothetical protein PUN28_007724 [Cardiocondyla obscurior]|uniref:Uncharacterized protein n=1 Tax=Cardiocondyla obscurior TaxID=286306 RepID=A0AAW2FWD8_9HYME
MSSKPTNFLLTCSTCYCSSSALFPPPGRPACRPFRESRRASTLVSSHGEQPIFAIVRLNQNLHSASRASRRVSRDVSPSVHRPHRLLPIVSVGITFDYAETRSRQDGSVDGDFSRAS